MLVYIGLMSHLVVCMIHLSVNNVCPQVLLWSPHLK